VRPQRNEACEIQHVAQKVPVDKAWKPPLTVGEVQPKHSHARRTYGQSLRAVPFSTTATWPGTTDGQPWREQRHLRRHTFGTIDVRFYRKRPDGPSPAVHVGGAFDKVV
jgi:hypothetical protein